MSHRLKIQTNKIGRSCRLRRFSRKSITLVELLISVTIVSLMVLSFYSIENFSRNQLLNSDRRIIVQNQLSLALEHMSKYVQQASGNQNNPAIVLAGSGFRVRVDFNQTPGNFTDDAWVSYSLAGNTLSTNCSGNCGPFTPENLSAKVVRGFVDGSMPANPTSGFYVSISNQGSLAEVGLLGRFSPTDSIVTPKNPQVAMKTKLICNNCSTN